MTEQWNATASIPAPEGVVVQTRGPWGMVQDLVRDGGLWFFPDRSMYVYYTPVAWRAKEPS